MKKSPVKVYPRNIRRAWRSVNPLNNCLDLYNIDVKADDFIGYKLVDFGLSWTEPHKLLDFLGEEGGNKAKAFRLKDTVNFENMVEDEKIRTRKPEWADRKLPKRRRITFK
ncbi:hypothetical protein RRF57_011223 [Xylaria bambusicola]|uniref:Uncharacterized protein n=1 Tax=Xylaria bambusicola TaxID=326684 RepID=A0AAN7ZCZ7_9PEZI